MQDRIHSLKSIISEHYRMFETMKFSLALKPALDIWSKSLIFNWFVISTRVRVINELFSCSQNVVRRSIYRWHHKSRHLWHIKFRVSFGALPVCWWSAEISRLSSDSLFVATWLAPSAAHPRCAATRDCRIASLHLWIALRISWGNWDVSHLLNFTKMKINF